MRALSAAVALAAVFSSAGFAQSCDTAPEFAGHRTANGVVRAQYNAVSRGEWADVIHFGEDILEEDVAETLDRMNVRERHRVQRYDDIELKVAGYLASGDIVARVKGREEFGARALGNRSILANPSVHQVVSVINKMIKSRDFWMPFSPTVLDKREEEYLQNPKRLRSPYMMLTFDSTPVGLEKLTAACHPYDGTLRPQILEREVNPDYYRLIEIFEELTGIGAILNTSYNLHGEPIVSNAEDAIHTFETSGLPHLALGQYLISKKNA